MIGLPLDHIAIHIDDAEAAIETVRELLGYEHAQVLEVPAQEGSATLTVLVQRGDRFRMVLCESRGDAHPISKWLVARGPGVHHLAHRVEMVEDALDAVEASGGTRGGELVEAPGLRQVFAEVARDGLLHELTQRMENEGFEPDNTRALIDAGGDRNADAPASVVRRDRR